MTGKADPVAGGGPVAAGRMKPGVERTALAGTLAQRAAGEFAGITFSRHTGMTSP